MIKQSPIISVIIPLRELSYFLLFENLPALDKQTYKKFEVIVLPNHSTVYDLTLVKKYPWLRIIPTGKITRPAKKRDIGVKKAKGTIIAFIDDDAYPNDSWLENAVKLFNKPLTTSRLYPVSICGPGILPKNVNFWEKVFDEVLKTWVGSGGYNYRFIQQKERFVDDYPSVNFFVQRKIFIELGGFNSKYWPGEDSKLCEDIVYKKHREIMYNPAVVVYHHRRNSLKSYVAQHASYGFHRGAFFSHGDNNSRKLAYLVPSLFIFYLLILLCIVPASFALHFITAYLFILLFPLFLYCVALFYLFIKTLLGTRNILVAFASPLILFLTHFTYGIIFLNGLRKGIINKKNLYR